MISALIPWLLVVVIGIPVGILMGKSRLLDELLLPWVNIFLSAPLTALDANAVATGGLGNGGAENGANGSCRHQQARHCPADKILKIFAKRY